jgi:hypothetical protein
MVFKIFLYFLQSRNKISKNYVFVLLHLTADWLRDGRPRGRSSSPGGSKNFHFSMSSSPSLGSTESPIQWVQGALSPDVKQPGRETDHSLPSSGEIKKRGSI